MNMKANQKLTDDHVREIREKFAAGTTKKELAFDYNVSYPTITRVIRGLRRGKVV
jgi:Helix-turn-helix.